MKVIKKTVFTVFYVKLKKSVKNHFNLTIFLHFFFFSLGWQYSSGFVDADMIKDHLFEPSDDNLVLLCGPPPMINFACIPNLDKIGYGTEMRFAY